MMYSKLAPIAPPPEAPVGNGFSSFHSAGNSRKVAFTLAEVLITLGIIGVVAALTMPVLLEHHSKTVVETRLKKIYSVMNQAILMSENVNGAKEEWNFGDPEFLNKYILKFLNHTKSEELQGNKFKYNAVYFTDGSLLIAKTSNNADYPDQNGGMHQDYYYYPNAKNFDFESFESRECVSKTCFAFRFAPSGNKELNINHLNKGFEPYMQAITTKEITEEILTTHNTQFGCIAEATSSPNYCTALIQRNGWKIPNNYPFKVR